VRVCKGLKLIGKSLLALRGVGPESEAESGRFHGRRVAKVSSEVKQGAGGLRAAEQGVRKARTS
jgi:hypothetical protein